ncbi:MAG TPA: CoA pyrophosphatase [Thermoanaerobaculia bacterium]|jgi:8-oxo-dGTP pyrophosphatase MutT (NUDIX family)|nr:CoA pyrophosphatase [Thermoanaerobaculia bacterium]
MDIESQDSENQERALHSWIIALRERLASPPPRRLAASDFRQASVLVPLYVDAGELWTVLTVRTDTLPSHRSQIAFPGGGKELKEDAWAAALRETQEEIGLDPKKVLRLGELDEVESPAGFRVIPCVGAIPFPYKVERNAAEIAEIFSLPLSYFSNPKLVEEQDVLINGVRRNLRIYHIGNRRIWGLTARILQNLMIRLGLEPDEEN